MSYDVYSKLPYRQRHLEQVNIEMITASGAKIPVEGKVKVNCRLQDLKVTAEFFVLPKLTEPIILGMDFLREQKAILNLDNNTFEMQGKRISLTPQDQINSFGRLTADATVPPQTAISCNLKPHKKLHVSTDMPVQVTSIDTGFFGSEPGIFLVNSVTYPHPGGHIPAILVNNTHREVNFKKGNVIATIQTVDPQDIQDSTTAHVCTVDSSDSEGGYNINTEHVTPAQLIELSELIEANADLFAQHDYDIGRTDLLEARIKTTDEIPIRRKPYAVPLALRDQVNQQIHELVQNGIIRPSN